MSTLIPSVGVALAAFCVWLGVRIINRRERWAKWTLAGVVGLPVLYVASFGPACWIASRMEIGAPLVPVIYRPLVCTFGDPAKAQRLPVIGRILVSYSDLFAAKNWGWECSQISEGWKWAGHDWFPVDY